MEIIVETFRAPGEKSHSPVRVRPLPNQGLSTDIRVECSKQMRNAFPVGQLFRLNVKIVSRLGSSDFLYSNYRESWQPVTKEHADSFIRKMFMDK
jgi:hypothetical protein